MGAKAVLATAITRLIVTGTARRSMNGNEYGARRCRSASFTMGLPDTFKIAWPGYAAGGSVTGDIVIVTTCGHDVHDYDGNAHHHEGSGYNH
jgi:hypothetical protein